MNTNEQIQYYRTRLLQLMADCEDLYSRYHKRTMFEVQWPELTEEVWSAIDSKDKHKLMFVNSKLCKLADSIK